MIQAYAFIATFAVQILALSVLQPVWFSRYVRAQAASLPAERLAQLHPGGEFEFSVTLERYLTAYHVVNTVIAVLGLALLAWSIGAVQDSTNWDDGGEVVALHGAYSMLQFAPLILHAWLEARNKARLLKHSLPEGKRKASLRRRGLFDFVSPFTVSVAFLGYFLYVAYVFYVAQNPFPRFPGYFGIVTLTLVYATEAFAVYRVLYGKKINAVETHAGSVHKIGLGVRGSVYACIIFVVYLSLKFTLKQLGLNNWMPVVHSSLFVIFTLFVFISWSALSRRREAEGLGESAVS